MIARWLHLAKCCQKDVWIAKRQDPVVRTHLRCKTLRVRHMCSQLLQHREARRHISWSSDNRKVCPCPSHSHRCRPGASPTCTEAHTTKQGMLVNKREVCAEQAIDCLPELFLPWDPNQILMLSFVRPSENPPEPQLRPSWPRNAWADAGVPEPPQAHRCQICGRTDAIVLGGSRKARLSAMSPSAPSVAPRRGQGVVEGVKVSAALLSAFSSLSSPGTDSKSAFPADLSEQASTSSPRALVGVRCCPEVLPQARLRWISRSIRGVISAYGLFVWIPCDLHYPPLPAPTQMPPLVCPSAERGVSVQRRVQARR